MMHSVPIILAVVIEEVHFSFAPLTFRFRHWNHHFGLYDTVRYDTVDLHALKSW